MPRRERIQPGEPVVLPGEGRPVTAFLNMIRQQFQKIWDESGGLPGPPIDETITPIGDGYYRQYASGRIYLRVDRGGFHVYGAIGDKYAQLGGPTSWLGWPTSPEQKFDSDGRAAAFENGGIYFWPDTGAIELGDVVVRYTGLLCFSETDDGTLSAHDEPYFYFGVVPASGPPPASMRSRIYGEPDDPQGGVDAGGKRIDSLELYRGLPYGMALSVTLMEHDFGDPDKYLGLVQEAVKKGGDAVAVAAAAIPYVGPFISVAVKAAMDKFGDDIVRALNDLLDTDDDFVDSKSFLVSGKQMVTLARAAKQEYRSVQFDLQSPLLEGDGGSYKVCITITPS